MMPVESLAFELAKELSASNSQSSPIVGPLEHLTALALDRVRLDREAYFADVLAYGSSDLLVHRAEGPSELVRRQAANWDPVLDWAATALGAQLRVGMGICPINQSESALNALESALHGSLAEALSLDFALAAMSEMTALSGSLVLALATAHGWLPSKEAWSISIVDEDWQAERWGVDREACAAQERRRMAFFAAAECVRVLRATHLVAT